jgi:hypothetical protein
LRELRAAKFGAGFPATPSGGGAAGASSIVPKEPRLK